MTRGQAPQQRPLAVGKIHAVPCPYCGKAQDLRELQSQQLLDTGHGVVCDMCHRRSEVAAIQTTTVVGLRPASGAPVLPVGSPRQATTISPQQAQRLLRGGRR